MVVGVTVAERLAEAKERYETIRTGLYRYPTASLLHDRLLVRAEIAALEAELAETAAT